MFNDFLDLIREYGSACYYLSRASPEQFNAVSQIKDNIFILLEHLVKLCYYSEMETLKYIDQWKKDHTRRYLLQLNLEKDHDLVELLSSVDNVNGFLKKLLYDYLNTTK